MTARGETRHFMMLATEAKLLLRDRAAFLFAVGMPALILIGAGLAIPGMRDSIHGPGALGQVRLIHVFTPAVLTMALATPSLSTLPVLVATNRERGVLRRLATTPVSSRTVLLSQVAVSLAAFLVAAVLTVAVAFLAFEVPPPKQPLLAGLSLALGGISMFGVGLLIAARARKASTASGMGMLLYFPLLFLAGMWTPGPLMPETARHIATYTPTGALSQTLSISWFGGDFPALQLIVMAGWALLLYPAATRFFRWS